MQKGTVIVLTETEVQEALEAIEPLSLETSEDPDCALLYHRVIKPRGNSHD